MLAMSRPASPLGPSIQGCPKAGLAGQACISFLSQVNISLASSPPSLGILGHSWSCCRAPGPVPSSRLALSSRLCQLAPQRGENHQPASAGLPKKVAKGLGFIRGMDPRGRIASIGQGARVGSTIVQVGAVRGAPDHGSDSQRFWTTGWDSLPLGAPWSSVPRVPLGNGLVLREAGPDCWPLAQGTEGQRTAGTIVLTKLRAPEVRLSHRSRLGCSLGSIGGGEGGLGESPGGFSGGRGQAQQ